MITLPINAWHYSLQWEAKEIQDAQKKMNRNNKCLNAEIDDNDDEDVVSLKNLL